MLVCLYEDRLQQIPGVKLLILSLHRYCPAWAVRLRFPRISPEFRSWLSAFPQVQILDVPLQISGSFNVKPAVILDGLSSGAAECLWMDTDVLVNGDPRFLAEDSAETITVTQDPWSYASGSTHRSLTWGLKPGRELEGPLNSAVVRVTEKHRPLLEAWQTILCGEEYLRQQALHVDVRHRHLLGDQDALSALLASEEFAGIPVRILRHPAEILQHHGAGAYGPKQRWQNLVHGMPPLLHAMGSVKPWRMKDHPSAIRQSRDYYERAYLELSPYVHFARGYRDRLQEDAPWMDRQTIAGKVGTALWFNQPALKGVVQATLHRSSIGLKKRP